MTPLPPDREAVILREIRSVFSFARHESDEDIRKVSPNTVKVCHRIWSHVESLHAAALVEARREGAYEALTRCIAWMVRVRGVDVSWTRDVERWRDCEYPLPRPAIAPVPLSGGRTLAWDGEEYVVASSAGGLVGFSNPDGLIGCIAHSLVDARTILAFVAQVEGVATC